MSDDWGNDPLKPMVGTVSKDEFKAILNKVYGPGRWNYEGGFRSKAREDQLRRQGAGTVPKGHVTPHSEGTEDEPGAFDFVVPGMSQKEAAAKLAKADSRFSKVFAEAAQGGQGGHVHAATGLTVPDHEAWGNDPLTPVDAASPKPTAPKSPPAKPKPARQENIIDQYGQDLKARRDGPAKALAEDFTKPLSEGEMAAPLSRVGRTALDAVNYATGPIQAAVDTEVGGIWNALTGRHDSRQKVGDVASLAIPVAGEVGAAREAAAFAKEAGVSVNTAEGVLKSRRAYQSARMAAPPAKNALKAVPGSPEADTAAAEAKRAARVQQLQRENVELTPGMQAGGRVRRAEEAATSSPYVGQAHRDAEMKAIRSFNRATYNRVLAPIGERYTGPVGREGVANVERTLGHAYDQVLPQVRVKADHEIGADINILSQRSAKLGKAQAEQFKAILEQDVMDRFTGGNMDGRTFKNVESDLSRQARNFRSSPDPNHRELGRLIDELNDSLRENVERNSAPGVRQRLKEINTSWAAFTRVQEAATRRNGADGVFDTGDLVAAVKKSDRSVRKGAFARGDAMLQDFAEAAHDVIRTKLPDSGTAGRVKEGLAGRVIGGAAGAALGHHLGPFGMEAGAAAGVAAGQPIDRAVGGVTNHLARLSLARRAAARTPSNYLAHSTRAVSPLVAHRVIGAGGVASAAAGGNQ